MTNIKIDEQNELDFVTTFQSLITGVLNNLRILPCYSYYDDCYQIGLIKLFEACKEYPGDFHTECGLYQFSGYAFMKIKWGVIDECRKFQRYKDREEKLPECYEELSMICNDRMEDELTSNIDLANFLLWLTDQEQLYLNLFFKYRNISKVALEMGVSRKTVYEIRKRIAVKYQCFNKE